jgi:hypothetical protein
LVQKIHIQKHTLLPDLEEVGEVGRKWRLNVDRHNRRISLGLQCEWESESESETGSKCQANFAELEKREDMLR